MCALKSDRHVLRENLFFITVCAVNPGVKKGGALMEGIYHILKPCQESPEKFPQEIPLFFVYAFLYKKRILSREKHLKS
jgi:hypothetical protein